MSQPRPEIELDTLPNWVCMAEGEDGTNEAHLTTYINTDNGLSVGCSEHPFSGGCSIPRAALADLIAQEADKLANKRLRRGLTLLADLSPCAGHENFVGEHTCVKWIRDNIRQHIAELDKGDRQRLHDELTKQSHLKSLRSQGLDSDAELDR